MRRFWSRTAIAALPEGGFAILLDERRMRLPGGAALTVQSERLATAIAAEWQEAGGAEGGEMSFADTPLTRLAGTAQARIGDDPAPVVQALARYAESDLLCYRTEAPDALVQRQAQLWDPLLDWAAQTYGARLVTTAGVMFAAQDPAALAALRDAVAAYDADMLAALGLAVPATGSLVLGLALARGRVDAEQAHALAALDELFQAGLWGEDAEAAARRRLIAAEIALAARFMALVSD